MASGITMEKVAQPELAKHESSILDLVFVMDCTGSMGSYIVSATNNIRSIVEEIVVNEKSDIRLALVEYRDHPPQDHTFVTRVHDFTSRVSEMKGWLEQCQAIGGGDAQEAVADGLHAVLKLSWRTESTKICILIADAPPHGLDPNGDGFPNGCPCGLDPIQIVREMAEKSIALYSVGVEPSITRYRDFFMSLAYITGGQYVPMVNAKLLAKVIIGGVREEISLDRLMQTAEEDINREMQRAEAEGVDDKEKITRISNIFSTKNLFSTQMTNTFGATSVTAKGFSSNCHNMAQQQIAFLAAPQPVPSIFTTTSTTPFSFATPPTTFSSPFGAPVGAAPTATASIFGSTAISTTAPGTASFESFTFGAPSTTASDTPVFGFGAPTAAASETPSFTFGAPTNAASVTPLFGFGAPTTAASETPLFGFGTSTTAASETPSFTFGAPTTAASETPLFGFGASTTATSETPLLGFGAPTTAASETPLFGFGTSTTAASETPSFTFGAPTNAASETPLFGFGASTTATSETPLLGFGAPTTAASETPLFGFGTSTTAASETPSFTFGAPTNAASETPLFGFGTSTTAASETPSFTFGAPTNAASETPLFGFGASTTATSETPLLGFGAPTTAASETPLFGFGTSTTAASETPSFTFGASTTATSETPLLGFGAPTVAASETPLFGFGASSTNVFGSAPFSFATSTDALGTDGTTLATRTEADINYDVMENAAVNKDQAERIYQKWQQRKK